MKALRLLPIIIILFCIENRANAQMPDKERYQMMIDFLSKNGGKWESMRENFDETGPGSVRGDGYYCYIEEDKNILRIRLVSHFRGSDFTTYERTWYWNASDKKIQFITFASAGKIEKGFVEVVSEKAFVLNYDMIDEEGKVLKRKEESFISNEREFETKVFELRGDTWEEIQKYNWKK